MTREEYLALVEEINRLDYNYYTLDKPVVTDKKYDELYSELEKVETENPEWKVDISPTIRAGGPILSGFEKAHHTIPLLSLDKAQNYDEILKFFKDILKVVKKPVKITLEQKMDGLSIVLRYEDGNLVQARTRGRDGVGEVVTTQVKTIRSIPLTIQFKGTLEVQGEIFMPYDRLKELNDSLEESFNEELEKLGKNVSEEQLKKLQDKYKSFNERNVAAGTIRNLDPKVAAGRKLEAFFYNIPYVRGIEFETQELMMEFLVDQGFKVNPYFLVLDTFEELLDKLEEMKSIRPTLNFAIDGMVIKVNEVKVREEIGYTSKFPKWAIAFKFEASEETTIVNEVVWEIGRTGKLTPVALVEPVDFDGVTVQRATLNNKGDILRKGVLLGGEVIIRRSNDVIPEVMGAVPDTLGKEITIPTNCPSCDSKVSEVGAHLYCTNEIDCPAQVIGKLVHFCSREAMNIDTLSKKTVTQLYENELIKDSADIYELTKDKLLTLDRFGEKKAVKLLEVIEKSKLRPFHSVLYALGIRNVGKDTAEKLVNQYSNIKDIQDASIEDLCKIEDVAEVVAKSIKSFFGEEKTKREIERLSSFGLNFSEEIKKVAGGKFEGKSFVITGTLSKTRTEIEEYIKSNGGKVSGSVSKKTTFLVAGENPGSNLGKAEKLGIQIIGELDLY